MAAVYDAENASRSDNARQNADVYAAEYKMVRQLAEVGTKVETAHRMLNGSYGGEMTLTEDQFAAAYREGRDAAAANSRENEEIDKRISEGARRKQGKVYFNGAQGVKTAQGVLFLPASGIDSDWARSKTLSEEQKAAIRFAKNVLSKYGVDVVFYSSAKNKSLPNGLYDGKRIYIDIEAGMSDSTQESLVMYAIAHELTHMAERLSPELWKRYAGLVMEILAEREGISVSELIARKQNEHEAAGVAILRKTYSESEKTSDELREMVEPLSEKGAIREIVADASQLILTRKGGLAEELAKKDARFWEKIKELVIKAIRRMQEVLRGVPRDGVSEHLVNHLDELAVYFNEMMADTLYRAGYQERAKNTSAESNSQTGGEVQFSHARQYDGEKAGIHEQIRNSQDQLNQMAVVFSSTVPQKVGNKEQAGTWAIAELKKYGFQADRQGFGKIYFSEKSIRDAMNYLDTAEEKVSIVALYKVLKQGIQIGEHGNHKLRDKHTITLAAPVELNGIRGNMAVVVNMRNNMYKVHRILMPDGSMFKFEEIKKDAERESQRGVPKGSLANATSPASNNSISQDSDLSTENSKVPENSNNGQTQTRRGGVSDRAALAEVAQAAVSVSCALLGILVSILAETPVGYHCGGEYCGIFDLLPCREACQKSIKRTRFERTASFYNQKQSEVELVNHRVPC